MTASTTEVREAPRPAAPVKPSFRSDVDGLRAVAIVVVVLFHAHLAGFSGGFVGVDVFFVISGFLITRNVLSEIDRTARVGLATFWARRMRRLVPELALVVLATLAGSMLVLARIDLPTVGRQGASAALYVSNLLFGSQSADYFGGDVEHSPFLHTWSLGVEEQFYILWPILLAALVWAFRTRRGPIRSRIVAMFAITGLASFALSVRWARSANPWGFYSLPSRWWEFAVAGILAAVPVPERLRRRPTADLVAGGGLLAIAVATVGFESSSSYPGAKALLPVLGTVAVIVGAEQVLGSTPPLTSRALSAAPMQWVGRVSYSWYLWHWPFMVLAAAWLADTVPVRLTAGLVALPVAALTYRFYETPVRFSPVLTRSNRRTFAATAAATAVVVAACLGVVRLTEIQVSGSSLDRMLQAARDDPRSDPCEQRRTTADGVDYCVGGAVGSDRVVLLVGDSHARQWKLAMLDLAREEGFELVDAWAPSCPVVPVDTSEDATDKGVACQQLRDAIPGLIRDVDADLVVLSEGGFYLNRLEVDGHPAGPAATSTWSEAYRSWLTSVRDAGPRLAVVFDNPGLVDDPVECVARERDVDACAVNRATLSDQPDRSRAAEEQVIDDLGGIPSFGTTGLICGETTCEVGTDDLMIFVDEGHLSREFTRSLHDPLRAFLDAGFAGTAGHYGDAG